VSIRLGPFSSAVLAAALIHHAPAAAQDSPRTETLPDVVVTTPGRMAQPLAQTGSAVTVVTREELATTNPGSVIDALRSVPGVDLSETGGPGGTIAVRLRGASPGQTLVMIDGIRVNDPSGGPGEFDFSLLPPSLIERIEVLRGPQSALYGSDAIGGVVNVITKTGSGPPRAEIRAEAGSYGTVSTNGALSGSNGPWSYAFSGTAQRSDGFSRYGYRIPEIEARFPRLENDGFLRFGGYGKVAHDAGNGVRFEIGALSTWTRADYDAATGAFPDTPSLAERVFQQAWARSSVDTFDGALTHTITAFVNRTYRWFNDVSYRTNMLPRNTTSTISEFVGDRVGAEYQGNLRLGAFGSLVFGSRYEHETANTFSERLLPTPLARSRTLAAEQDTRSIFALYQLPIGERLILSLGGRVDDIPEVDRFATWRATAAYLIPETGTKLRASAGTGGKAPTLFQRFDPSFGNPNLTSEESFGADAGFDQTFFNGRATLSVTAFKNEFSNLIEFGTNPNCTALQTFGCYSNVARAQSRGVEVGADAELWPSLARLKIAYTYLDATDERTGKRLSRRPEHAGRVALALTPTEKWLIEPRVFFFSERFSGSNETNRLEPYTRLDVYTEYRIDPTWKVFARLENATDTRYQEVFNFGTTGRALYGGFNAAW
jgi:vitamin B12 transporter